jgi:hypothetical protein
LRGVLRSLAIILWADNAADRCDYLRG